MRRIAISVGALALVLAAGQALAQQVFVYPQKGQSQQQQDIDNGECTRWAKGQTGVDPNAPAQPQQPGGNAGGAVRGAAKGAAVGAAVGGIAGDAGKGAGAGAVVGGVAGRRQSKNAKEAAAAETANTYQRAFGACMEGRGYSVK